NSPAGNGALAGDPDWSRRGWRSQDSTCHHRHGGGRPSNELLTKHPSLVGSVITTIAAVQLETRRDRTVRLNRCPFTRHPVRPERRNRTAVEATWAAAGLAGWQGASSDRPVTTGGDVVASR